MTDTRINSKGEREVIADMAYTHLKAAYFKAGRQINDGTLTLVSQETRDRVWAEHDAMGHEIARRDQVARAQRQELEAEGIIVVPHAYTNARGKDVNGSVACTADGEPIAGTESPSEDECWWKAWGARKS